jgi:hypothetical protein
MGVLRHATVVLALTVGLVGCSGDTSSDALVESSPLMEPSMSNEKCEEWRGVYADRVIPAMDSISGVIAGEPKSYADGWRKGLPLLEAALAEEAEVIPRMPLRTREQMSSLQKQQAGLVSTVRDAITMRDMTAAYDRIALAEHDENVAMNALMLVCLDTPV